MNKNAVNVNLYLLNMALLFTHEIESAYWKEWDMFGIPGGLPVFLVLNFLLLVLAIFGFGQLLQEKKSGVYFSLLLSAAGIFAFCIHTYFILQGRDEFTLPISMILLGLIVIISIGQGYQAIRTVSLRAIPAR